MGVSDLDVVELVWSLSLVGKGTTLVRHMTNFATTEAASFFGEAGLFLWSEPARESVGVAAMIGASPKTCKVVHLGAKIVDGNMEVVDVHSIRIVLGGGGGIGGSGGSIGKEDGVDQCCLADSNVQGFGLSKLDFLAGIRLKALDKPVQSSTLIESGDAAKQAAKLVRIEGDGSFALLERFEGLAGGGNGVRRGMEGEEVGLEGIPGSLNGQSRRAPPGLGIINQIQGRILDPFGEIEFNNRKIFFLVVDKINACISINCARVSSRPLWLEDLSQGTGKIAAVGLKFALGECRCGRGGHRNGDGIEKVSNGNLTLGVNASEEGVELV